MNGINKLQAKWGVGPAKFWLIILTFALGGSLSGRLCSYLLKLVFLEKNLVFWLIYPLFLTILWPFSVIFVSFFTGQFSFFKGYLGRVGVKLFGGAAAGEASGATSATSSAAATLTSSAAELSANKTTLSASNAIASQSSMAPIHVAIFASGAGSNARKIIEYFENQAISEFYATTASETGVPSRNTVRTPIKVSLIVCNVPNAGVLEIAKEKGIPTLLINKAEFAATGYVESLKNADIHFIVLAGFLWKVPEVLVKAYQAGVKIDAAGNESRGIINIHPALLPNYGGKGMYGSRVHEAVIAAGETESGITIHWVDAHYDEGDIIFQASCVIEAGDTPEILAQKIHALEHAHFAPTIEKILLG